MNSNYSPIINKKEWLDEYKKITNSYKVEEKNLIHTFLKDDFHLNKIYEVLLKDEVDLERKILDDTLKQIKSSVNDVMTFFQTGSRLKNMEIRHKIHKIEEILGKSRVELKNKFENLMNEEDTLERELKEFEEKLVYTNKIEDSENNINYEENKENPKISITPEMKENKNKKMKNNPIERIEEYVDYIINSSNIVFDEYPIEEILKIVKKFSYQNLETIKSIVTTIEQLLEKNLGGNNLTWQTRDHQDFLKVRAIHNNKINTYEFLNELENTLPFIPRSELKNHIKSFNKFYQLNELKKLLIMQYKEIKEEKELNAKKELLEKITTEKRCVTATTNKNEILENKVKVEEWKKKKVQENRKKYEEQARIEQDKKEYERKKYIEKATKVKPLIEEFKKNKEILNKPKEDRINCHNLISEIDLERINERNEKLLDKRILLVRSKSVNLIKKAENYTKYKLKKMEKNDNIPVKIQDKTENFARKKRNKHDYNNDSKKDACTMANNVLGKMTRAVPQWRKSLI